MKGSLVRAVGLTLATLMVLPAFAGAQRAPLPSFTVSSTAGVAVPSTDLSQADRWLLVYVMPGSVASERLLRALDEWTTDGARVVVIAAGETSAGSQVRSLLTASAAAIYTDADGSAARALGVTSASAVAGVADGALDWIVQGVLNDPRMVEPVVRSWLAGRQ